VVGLVEGVEEPGHVVELHARTQTEASRLDLERPRQILRPWPFQPSPQALVTVSLKLVPRRCMSRFSFSATSSSSVRVVRMS
jgi:hypothetical protein